MRFGSRPRRSSRRLAGRRRGHLEGDHRPSPRRLPRRSARRRPTPVDCTPSSAAVPQTAIPATPRPETWWRAVNIAGAGAPAGPRRQEHTYPLFQEGRFDRPRAEYPKDVPPNRTRRSSRPEESGAESIPIDLRTRRSPIAHCANSAETASRQGPSQHPPAARPPTTTVRSHRRPRPPSLPI